MSSDPRWRVAAVPRQLLALASATDQFAETIGSARRRVSSTRSTDLSALNGLIRRSVDIAAGVRTTGHRLDAADLAGRLDRYSTVLRVSMQSRALRHRSSQTRRLGVGNDRKFLHIVTAGNGRVVELFGDLQRAKHVALIVPGMTNSINDYDPNTRIKGRELAGAMRAFDPDVAVVAWLGYRTPNLTAIGLVEGAGSKRARAGARELVDDLEVIRRMAPSAHLTVVGHSYGSVVAGETLRSQALAGRVDALGLEDVAVVGSPGMNTTSRAALGHRSIEVWASKVASIEPGSMSIKRTNNGRPTLPFLIPLPVRVGPFGAGPVEVVLPHPSDVIPFAPVHGEDPSAPGYGAKRFSSAGAHGHGEYFSPGTVSLENLARIATNRPVVRPDGTEVSDRRQTPADKKRAR